MTERVGISGSNGFLGKRLTERLEQSGYDVIRLGREGSTENSTVVFDLAAYGNMPGHKGDPKEIYQANLMRVIESAEGFEGKFIYVSSSSVMLPQDTHYSISKRAAEQYLQSSDIKCVIARPFSVTGVGDQEGHLIPKLIDSAMTGSEMPFVPDPVHDFIDVQDIVNALVILAGNVDAHVGEVFDLGTGIETSNIEVAATVSEVVGSSPNVKVVESMRKYDTDKWKADTKKMKSLGWKPQKTLRQSIEEMYAKRKNT